MSSVLWPAHDPAGRPLVGVPDPVRLAVVADAARPGRFSDPDLDAVVATLRIALRVPLAVVDIVTPGVQTYPAETGAGGSAGATVTDRLSFCAEVVETGAALVVPDASRHPTYAHNPLVESGAVLAYAGEPLVDGGVVLGAVSVFDTVPRLFGPEELALLRHQARLAAAVLSLRRSGRSDWLTGLANRAVMRDRLGSAITRLDRQPGVVAVLFVDVDDFKRVNDERGHQAGDQLLIALAQRMKEALRPSDTLARFGGDEFVVVCEDLAGSDDACAVAERLVSWLRRGLSVGGEDLDVTVSIGVAVTDLTAHDPDALVREADAAMYRAKREPGSQWVLALDVDASSARMVVTQ
ncbi:MAG TPA: sensor domain-containing diguanylate cyclase [Mycobacteriales bacterium]|nr:sensor domain-containing diguanylate cyclase [Mycobacteriales bacterium]